MASGPGDTAGSAVLTEARAAEKEETMIAIDELEVLALKKLVLINHALSKSLSDPRAAQEQKALTLVLNDVALRADADNCMPKKRKV